MPDITLLPANLTALILESCLYGILLLLFLSTISVLATRRTMAVAGDNRAKRRDFTSRVFLGVAGLFIIITVHWGIVIYRAFFAFTQLGNATSEFGFYGDPTQPSEVAELILFFAAVLVGDALIIHRLWIIWGGNRYVMIVPICSLVGAFVTAFGTIYVGVRFPPGARPYLFGIVTKPWTGAACLCSFLTMIYSTAFIVIRISRAADKTAPDSRLMSFLAILVESAALQALWLAFTAATIFTTSDVEIIAAETFPAVIGISNLLILARVSLGWSQGSTTPPTTQPTSWRRSTEDAV
ncbi:hypothetical protein B0H15DRAFT_32432 [Mycena belliarum]|uniref:Uncharacterized protein n=1 Tax=Mycena belliarum TaxID=1033014 RepID=A0AAD6UDX7_9AGAR|nr:hypothetical protein B0H15DRAFT_32432 [Mycena belliae]